MSVAPILRADLLLPFRWLVTVVAAMACLMFTVHSAAKATTAVDDDVPSAISDLPFADAVARSREQGRVLLVMGTAVWCGPCIQMDKTTWVNPRVVQWARESGMVIKVDVDKEPELARSLNIRAMPTLIAFRNGEEFDRVMGYQDADRLLAWCVDVKDGRTQLDRLRESAGSRATNAEGKVDIRTRMELASGLVLNGRYDEALDEYVWLWENMVAHEPAMVGVRNSFLLMYMGELASKHPPAIERFTRMRDEAAEQMRGADGPTWELLQDWIGLNVAIEDEESILAWFDRIKERPGSANTFNRFSFRLEPMLIKHKRYKDLAFTNWDPTGELLRSLYSIEPAMAMMSENFDEEQRQSGLRMLIDRAAEQSGLGLAIAVLGEHDEVFADLLRAIERSIDDEAVLRTVIRSALRSGIDRATLRAAAERVWIDDTDDASEGSRKLRGLLRNGPEVVGRPSGRD